ncbi:hypothetical protein HTZ77_27140 [Nonomuraea sp. SMC257]|uniref:Uncharacterized protein n=1 Tax=Nonomuraea montanisoli TaxID=2741721 RepID=A0A7Y6IC80_9ACTN|nr:hypothetical protein [Nonomuraea montanisoli]NUW35078.1 hypothetical protein [Nonomuraea montanisoli]
MSRFLGQSVRGVQRIVDQPIELEVGIRPALDRGETRMVVMADELVISDTAA